MNEPYFVRVTFKHHCINHHRSVLFKLFIISDMHQRDNYYLLINNNNNNKIFILRNKEN
jgi:hypothetical protein